MTKMVCIKQGQWRNMAGQPVTYATPNYREIVVVEKEESTPFGEIVYLAGYDAVMDTGNGEPHRIAFFRKYFVPLIDPGEKADFRTMLKKRTPEHEDA